MNELMKMLANLKAKRPAKCNRCGGSGMVAVYGNYWSPQMCRCSACNGSGKAKEAA